MTKLLELVRDYRRRAEEVETIKVGDVEFRIGKNGLIPALDAVIEASMAKHPWPPSRANDGTACQTRRGHD
jgi:hypothetical protein